MFSKFQHIHFVGIGGIGMSGIAEVLLNLGYRVSGSDVKRTAITDRLESLGGIICEGHAAANIGGANVLVTSTAVRADNPEVVEAVRKQIPVIPRAEMLAELMRLKYGIAIAGSHGKTTTTSMTAFVLTHGGLDPTVVVGGRLNAWGSNAKLGKGDFILVEADESDKSFLKLDPTIAVVTNIDREHLDFYKDLEEIQAHFVQFVNKVPFYGAVIICLDDANVQAIIPQITRRLITYGMTAQADIAATQVEVMHDRFGSAFNVKYRGQDLGRVQLNVPGMHNVSNALAAISVGLDLELSFEIIASALETFRGAERRFQVKGTRPDNILVVDDYGHHPTEIRATLAAAKSSGRRLVTLFQPHRYTRTAALREEFARSFYDADVVLLTDIYAASEEPIEGITAQALAEDIERFGHRNVRYIGSVEQGAQAIADAVQPNDLVLTLGAGSVWKAGEEFLAT
jgi:UDP-N-acetylmuramate--alanine ligase